MWLRLLLRAKWGYWLWLLTLSHTVLPVIAQTSQQADTQATSPSKPVLIWCLNHFPPRHSYADGLPPSGPMVAMMQELAERSGFELQYTPPSPTNRCENLVAQGKADLMSSLLWSERRAQLMALLPFDVARISVIYRRPDSPSLTKAAELQGRKLVLTKDRPYPATLLTYLQQHGAQLLWGQDLDNALAMLLYDQADFFIGPQHYTELSRATNMRLAPLHPNDWQLGSEFQPTSYIGFSRQSRHQQLLPAIQQQLQQMVAEQKTHFYQ